MHRQTVGEMTCLMVERSKSTKLRFSLILDINHRMQQQTNVRQVDSGSIAAAQTLTFNDKLFVLGITILGAAFASSLTVPY